jgi:plastocyanin
VTFLSKSPTEAHNAAFGGDSEWLKGFMQATDLIPTAPGTPNQVSPFFPFGSEPPGAYVYTGSNHGNGFLATPVTDEFPGDPPVGPPQAAQVTFTVPGTYHYFCQLHGTDMDGDIIVTG